MGSKQTETTYKKEKITMKNSKKKLFIAALAICLVAIVSMGTLAWFTATDEVTNKFYVADSNTPDADGVFGIDLWEKDEDGNVYSQGDDKSGMVFEEIIAGDKLTKEPHLENTGIHPMWVRATVTVTGANILKEALSEDLHWMTWENLFAGKDDGQWVVDSTTYDPNTKELKYVLYYQKELAEGAVTEQIFDTVLIPTALTVDMAERLDSFNVVILGEAIQSENLGVATAKEAFETYWEEANSTPAWDIYADVELSGNLTPAAMDSAKTYSAIDGEWSSDPNVEEALFTASPAATNGVFHFAGGNYELQADDYLVYVEDGASAVVIYIWEPISVNGVEVARADVAQYFHNPNGSIIVQY